MRRKLRAKRRDLIFGRQRFRLFKKVYRSKLPLKNGEYILETPSYNKDSKIKRVIIKSKRS